MAPKVSQLDQWQSPCYALILIIPRMKGKPATRSGNSLEEELAHRPVLVAAIEDEADVDILKQTCAKKLLPKTNEPAHMKDSLLNHYVAKCYKDISDAQTTSSLDDESKYELVEKLLSDVRYARNACRRVASRHLELKDQEFRNLKSAIRQSKLATTKAKANVNKVTKSENEGVHGYEDSVHSESPKGNKMAQQNKADKRSPIQVCLKNESTSTWLHSV